MAPDDLRLSAGQWSMHPDSHAFLASDPLIRTAASSSLDEAIATPTSSECDENVTIHADTIIANASLHSSPSVKKEIKKDTKKEVKKEVK